VKGGISTFRQAIRGVTPNIKATGGKRNRFSKTFSISIERSGLEMRVHEINPMTENR
jgi:hypothetical protein